MAINYEAIPFDAFITIRFTHQWASILFARFIFKYADAGVVPNKRETLRNRKLPIIGISYRSRAHACVTPNCTPYGGDYPHRWMLFKRLTFPPTPQKCFSELFVATFAIQKLLRPSTCSYRLLVRFAEHHKLNSL